MVKKRKKLTFRAGKKLELVTIEELQQMEDEIRDSADMIREVVHSMQTFGLETLPTIPQALYKIISSDLPKRIRRELKDRIEELVDDE